LCHIGSDKIELVIKNALAAGLKLDSNDPFASICVPCVHGKHHQAPFPHQALHRSTVPFERIHSNLHKVPTLSITGFCYWLTFIDDASRHCWVFALCKKSDMFYAFQQFKTYVETQYNGVIRIFRQDKGGEFIGNVWDEFFAEHGIRQENTITATPEQNSVAERKNHILAELVTALLNESKLLKSFWAEALRTVNRVLNMLPLSALPPDTTPFEIIKKCKPDYSILHVFGCRAYAHVNRKARKLLDLHVTPCIFLGYPEDFRGWRLWDPRTKQIIISRDVIWDENSMPGNSSACHSFLAPQSHL
jgi:transposase InsO family protein